MVIISVTEIHNELLILPTKIKIEKSTESFLNLLQKNNHVTKHCLKMCKMTNEVQDILNLWRLYHACKSRPVCPRLKANGNQGQHSFYVSKWNNDLNVYDKKGKRKGVPLVKQSLFHLDIFLCAFLFGD